LHHWLKAHTLSQHKVRPLLDGDGIHLGLRGIELDAQARQRSRAASGVIFVIRRVNVVLVH
jgi:hypothetical protein